MKRIIGERSLAASSAAIAAVVVSAVGASSASAAASAVTRTFSFIGKANSRTRTVVNIDSLLINARCDAKGSPVVFAFSSASNADLFGRLFDGLGRIHIIKNSSLTSESKGVSLSPTSGDSNSTGTVLFYGRTARSSRSVDYALDNSTTLSKLKVCTSGRRGGRRAA